MTDADIISQWLRRAEPWPIDYDAATELGAFWRATPNLSRADTEAFGALLQLFMACDPWPDGAPEAHTVEAVLNAESRRRGYRDWTDAWHAVCMKPGSYERVDPDEELPLAEVRRMLDAIK